MRAVGSNQLKEVDLRIIAASNRDLKEEVRRGTFRLDLYYRLNVIALQLPPLRERREDVPDIIESIVASLSRKGVSGASFTPEALDLLVRNSWPGNIRELENVVERLLIFREQDRITASDVRRQLHEPDAIDVLRGEKSEEEGVLYSPEMSLSEVEEIHIQRVLEFHEGNRTRAAQVLGINVKTLYNKLRRYRQT